jgi:endoglucanase
VDKADATYNFIAGLNDPNIIATVHFYSDWVFTANLGITSFDEPLYTGVPDTARSHIDLLFDTLNSSFISKGVGVVIGEYGWLAPDSGPAVMQPGEKVKYFEYFNYKASQYGVCPMIWPAAFDRVNAPYDWNPIYGPVLKAAINGQRSSYATGLNEIYINQKATSGIQIPLTLNGNSFVGIVGLTNRDYSYNAQTATVTLSKDFVNKKFNGSYGTKADLVFQFSAGADWHQYIIKYATPVFQTAAGTTTDGITIPVTYNGSKVRRAAAFDAAGNRIGPTSWFRYMHFGGGEFTVDYGNGTFTLPSSFFNASVLDGTIKLTIEFFDGQVINYAVQKNGTNVTGLGIVP